MLRAGGLSRGESKDGKNQSDVGFAHYVAPQRIITEVLE
jgi:hypothetical protein